MLLDSINHQGAGLHALMAQQELRLIPILQQPGNHTEVETVWQLCSHLQRLGYSVAALDGSSHESDFIPGLDHLLGTSAWPDANTWHNVRTSSSSLAVISAANGLQRLVDYAHSSPGAALQPLHALFRSYAILVLYAPAALMAPLVQRTDCVPLVLTGAAAHGMVGSYLQIKHMAQHADVRCTVAALAQQPSPEQHQQTQQALTTLQHSALQHLGQSIRTTAIDTSAPQQLQRLALQLLENACPIDATMSFASVQPFITSSSPRQRDH